MPGTRQESEGKPGQPETCMESKARERFSPGCTLLLQWQSWDFYYTNCNLKSAPLRRNDFYRLELLGRTQCEYVPCCPSTVTQPRGWGAPSYNRAELQGDTTCVQWANLQGEYYSCHWELHNSVAEEFLIPRFGYHHNISGFLQILCFLVKSFFSQFSPLYQ